jgi:predicted nucleic acid-binding protein
MAAKVLDSWALIALFKGEPAAEAVEILLNKAAHDRVRLLLCVVNWGEIYYAMLRAGTRADAESAAEDIARMPIELVPVDTTNLDLVRQAAFFKATKKLSYGDCFAAALARLRRADLITGDAEFKSVESEVKIAWLK